MIELRRLPGGRIVAGVARLREATAYVVGIRGVLKVFQVARDACGAGQAVIIVDVAVSAGPRRHRVRACKSEVDHGMVEGSRGPRYRGVALRAVRREISGQVIWIRGPLKILEVAANAGGAAQVVIIVDVAVEALPRRHGVSTAQGESNRIVIELGIEPVVCGMAGLARGGELCGHMVRIRG